MVDVAGLALSETVEAGDFEAFVAVDASRLTDGELVDRLLTAQRMRARLDAAVVGVTDTFDRRLIGAADGAKTTAAWVTARVGVGYGYARADVDLGRALRNRPHITRAHQAGRLTRDQVQALLKVRSAGLEDAFDACEAILVDEVASCTLNAGRRFLARWVQEVRDRFAIPEPDGPDPGSPGGRSRAHLSPVGERWQGDLDLTAEDGELVGNAIAAQVDALWQQGVFHAEDGLDPAERRAVALVQVVERGTRGGDEDGIARPLILGIAPLSNLTGSSDGSTGGCTCGGEAHASDDVPTDGDPDETDHADTSLASSDDESASATSSAPAWTLPLASGLEGTLDPDDPLAGLDPLTPFPAAVAAELARSGPVHPEVLRRLACEGAVIPVYVGPGSDQLNMGRTMRIANRTQRRALRLRDKGCMFPGCSVPPEHCVAHHMIWWEHGGRTDIQNLVLICRFHHKAVHGGGFTIGRDPDTDQIVTTRTDDQPFTPSLRDRLPLVRPPPPPLAPDDAELDHDQATYLTRCRIDDLLRTVRGRRAWDTSNRCRERQPSDSPTLRG